MVGTDEKGNFTDVGPGTPADAWRRHPGWGSAPALTLAGVTRLVVVAAHPDDESLGAGGLIATAARQGLAVDIVCATDGEGSHPHSRTHTPQELAAIRAEEGRRAAEALGVEHPQRLEMSDGQVGEAEDRVTEWLVDVVGAGSGTVLVSPWRKDGHPDHEAAGRAAAAAARRTGAELWEFPVWFWHWGAPEEAPWTLLQPFDLDEHAVRAKMNAIRAHASQVAPLSDLEGDETLLPAEFLAHFETGPEHYLRAEG